MKRMLVAIAVFVAMSSLTSCISYTSSKITPSRSSTPMPPVQKKAYIEELTVSSSPSVWIRNAKQKKAGVKIGPQGVNGINNDVEYSFSQGMAQNTSFEASDKDFEEIARYIASCHPEIFSEQKEGAVPVKIQISGEKANVGGNLFIAALGGATFGIVPFGIYLKQPIDITIDTSDGISRKVSHSCRWKVTHKTAFCISPFGWIGASQAQITHFDSDLNDNADEVWQNFFMTPEFADNAAFAVTKVLNK